MKSEKLLSVVKKALEDKKATEIKILDVHKFSSITDFMVVATGRSARQVVALAQYVIEKAKSRGHRPLGNEGTNSGEWVLVDLGDVIVHVMQPQIRDFYRLEKLWAELGEDMSLKQIQELRDNPLL
jgi:ribosome-associated protein